MTTGHQPTRFATGWRRRLASRGGLPLMRGRLVRPGQGTVERDPSSATVTLPGHIAAQPDNPAPTPPGTVLPAGPNVTRLGLQGDVRGRPSSRGDAA